METKTEDGQDSQNKSALTGYIVTFPDNMTHIVSALFGVQSLAPEITAIHAEVLRNSFKGMHGPSRLERTRYIDPQGYNCEVFIAYWLDIPDYENWFSRKDVADWWNNLPLSPTSDLGYWREIMFTPEDRYQSTTMPTENLNGAMNLLPLQTSNKFGYKGAYRTRFIAADYDKFKSPESGMPVSNASQIETKGKRLTVQYPDNLCFLREGDDRSACTSEEKTILNERIQGFANNWIGYLRDNPEETGCLVLRDCVDLDVDTGELLDKKSQFVFMLSLGHIEHAAQTHHKHLSLKGSFMKAYSELPNFILWSEVLIIKQGELQTEYVNCHSATGLLPFFKIQSVQ